MKNQHLRFGKDGSHGSKKPNLTAGRKTKAELWFPVLKSSTLSTDELDLLPVRFCHVVSRSGLCSQKAVRGASCQVNGFGPCIGTKWSRRTVRQWFRHLKILLTRKWPNVTFSNTTQVANLWLSAGISAGMQDSAVSPTWCISVLVCGLALKTGCSFFLLPQFFWEADERISWVK